MGPADFSFGDLFCRRLRPGGHAAIGGEQAFTGRVGTFRGADKFGRMLSEGFRWKGVAAAHFWMNAGSIGARNKPVRETMYNSWQDYAILCRQWNWFWGAGERVSRQLKVFNDTRFDYPVTARYSLILDGEKIAGGSKEFSIQPGFTADWDIALEIPTDQQADRVTGEFILSSFVQDTEVFREVKKVAVVRPDAVPVPQVEPGKIAVWDMQGAAKQHLQQRGIPFLPCNSLENLPDSCQVLIIGADTLHGRITTDPVWQELVRSGKRIIVLNQNLPLHYQALGTGMEPSGYMGRIAHIENPAHPVLQGIEAIDLSTWNNDHVLYRNPLEKTGDGVLSLIQCDDKLAYTALGERRAGQGTLLFSQFLMGEKLGSNATAKRLFDNILNYALSYTPPDKQTVLAAAPNSALSKLFARTRLEYTTSSDPLKVLEEGTADILVAEAEPKLLRQLAENTNLVNTFTAKGGYLMLCQLTAEGMQDFNRLVGIRHALRDFFREKITLANKTDPFTAGISQNMLSMYTEEKIFSWQSGQWLADDVYTAVVDAGEDIAAFGVQPDQSNTVNGMLSSDAWKYIQYFDFSKEEPKMQLTFPEPYKLTRFSLIPNLHYHAISRVNLRFDDGSIQSVRPVRPEALRQDFPLTPVMSQKVLLTFEWTQEPFGSDKPVIGIDNLWLQADRSSDFATAQVIPLTHPAGLVKYPRSKGGIVLNQLNFKNKEVNPENTDKKQRIMATLLTNMGAKFTERNRPGPGSTLKYTPIPLEEQCNAFLASSAGWHDKKNDLSALPIGNRKFGRVRYEIRDFSTSPLENAILLKNRFRQARKAPKEVTIEVQQQADVLFFLHTFIPTNAKKWVPKIRKGVKETRTACEYVVSFTDGTQEIIPVQYKRDIDDWLHKDEGTNLKNAVLAWEAPATEKNMFLAVYQLQWNNPYPDKEIQSITMRYNRKEREWLGVPLLFAVTAAVQSIK